VPGADHLAALGRYDGAQEEPVELEVDPNAASLPERTRRASIGWVHGRVIVVGSGAAGLAAALAASVAGARVTVLERSEWLGGTTAISGGVAWLPASRSAAAAGIDDDPADALRYLRALGRGDFDDARASTFVHDAARVAQFVEDETPLEWTLLPDWPDYQPQLPGGRLGGRSIWPRPLEFPGELARRVQPTPEAPMPTTDTDDAGLTDAVVFRGPVRGRVLVGGLLTALLDRGVDVRVNTRVEGLEVDRRGVVSGVQLDGDTLAGTVILATGGFQHDAVLVRSFLPVPEVAPMGPPGCAGDGLRMAMRVGAAIGNMADGWWMPAIRVPGERLNGAQFFRPLHHERAQPGSLMVDRHGRRFVNEAQNYSDAGRAMLRFDAATYEWPAAPCWLVFDRAYRGRTPLGPLAAGSDDPEWLVREPSWSALAERLGLPPGRLDATVAGFNADAAAGCDREFGRGAHAYDRWIGDASAPDPNLAPLCEPPFYAVEVLLGCMGTKGGPRTDDQGRVLRDDGSAVAALYAAGNAAANPFGVGTPGGGGTIGPALVFGTRAGEAAAGE
jgi:3-oxosteroid 1-dehydrogenase